MVISPSQAQYLSNIRIPIRLSCIQPSGYPVIVSLWFLYRDGLIYCASSANAKIIDYIRISPRVGFEIAGDTPPYCGLRGYGTAELFPDSDFSLLTQLYHRYFADNNSSLYQYLTAQDRDEIGIRIRPTQVFAWNFRTRMRDSQPLANRKMCP